MEAQIHRLVSDFRSGTLSRREFLKRAAILLGGAASANALLLAATGAPIQEVAAAAGALNGQNTDSRPVLADDTIETAMVTFDAFGSTAPGYMARPKADGIYPAVVVVQEWWGLDDHIKSVVERFAHQGYAAVAPDLYRGKVAKEPSDAQRLVMSVQMPQALNDIQGAINYLIAQPFVQPKQAGVIGFCFGGGLAMMMSYKGQNVAAVATLYGAGVDPTDADLQNISAPVIGFYGGKDTSVPAPRIAHWYSTLAQLGKPAESHTYPDAMHAFFNDTRPSYNKAAADDAWTRVLAWFKMYVPVEAF